jgi:hypothetical protein
MYVCIMSQCFGVGTSYGSWLELTTPVYGWDVTLRLDTSADAFIGGWTCRVPPFSGVGNSSRLPMHVSSSKPKPRCKDPPLTVREALKEQTHPTNT